MTFNSTAQRLMNTFFISSSRIDESEADKNERLAKWQTFLENEDAKREIAEAESEMNQQESDETVLEVAVEEEEKSEIDSEL